MNSVIFRIITIFILLNSSPKLIAQINLYTEDLPRFYEAFDSVLTTADTLKQVEYIKKMYIEPCFKRIEKIYRT